MKRTIALSLCLAFVASVAFAFPFGMPPKENPLITKVAPEDSGMFLSWQSNGVADANSSNLVEQSLTKPEIQAKLKEMRESVLENLSNLPLFADFAKLAMRNGASFYVSDSKASSFAGMITLGENDLDAVNKLTAETNRLSNSGANVSTIDIGKLSFYKLSGEKDFYWGAFGKGKVVVFANSQKAITTILKNARTPEPAWVAEAKKEFNIERMSSLSATFGDVIAQNAKEKAAASDDADSAMADFQKKFLGGESVDKVVTASGLDSVGAIHKTAIYMKDGWKNTLPGIMIDKPLSENDLSAVPSNAVFALSGKTDLNKLLSAAAESEAVPDDMKMQMTMIIMMAKPYLASMGDSWSFFMTEDNGVSGVALVWSLKNPAMAKIQLKQLMEMLKKSFQRTEMEFDMGLNNRELRFIPTQLKLFGDDEEEDEDDNNNLPPNAQIEIQGQVIIPGGQIPNGGIPMQVVPGGKLPNGAVPLQVMPGGQIPQGAVPMGGGQMQLGGNIDPSMLLNNLPESIEKIKIDSYDFWLLKRGEDNADNIVIGIAGKNLIVTTKSYAENYVKFDGTKNLSSNKAVVRMMANNPSYLIYANQDSVPDILKGIVNGMVPSGAEQYSSILDVVTETKLPIVVGVYPKDDSVRVDVMSGLPIPDWMTFSFLSGISSAVTSQGN